MQQGSIVEQEDPSEVSSYELSPQTSNGDWTFNNGFSISVGNGYAEGSGCGIKGIKYSRNSNYKINIPDGITITRVELTGYSNHDTSTAYIQQLGENVFSPTDYVLPSRKGGVAVTFDIPLPVPATTQASFITKDAQIVANLILFTGTTGIEERLQLPTTNNVYTLDGILVVENANTIDLQSLPKGVYIIGNKKIFIK